MGTDTAKYIYNPVLIERYVYSLPLWRRILARYFEKYKITRQEYEAWFYNPLTPNK